AHGGYYTAHQHYWGGARRFQLPAHKLADVAACSAFVRKRTVPNGAAPHSDVSIALRRFSAGEVPMTPLSHALSRKGNNFDLVRLLAA
ncbi:hypothetical protein SB781_36130, partial [Paraburkholderia sp. SIMBA_061]